MIDQAQDVGRAVSDIFNKWATGGNETGKARHEEPLQADITS